MTNIGEYYNGNVFLKVTRAPLTDAQRAEMHEEHEEMIDVARRMRWDLDKTDPFAYDCDGRMHIL